MNALTPSRWQASVGQAISQLRPAESRAQGIANVKALEGMTYAVIADAYMAARTEAEDWPYGSDAQWADEAGVGRNKVSALNRLFEHGGQECLTGHSSWRDVEAAVQALPPKDGRSTTTVEVDGEPVEAEVLPPAEAVDLDRFEEDEREAPGRALADQPPPKPRKLTKREQEERDLRLQRARERTEAVSILRKLDRKDLGRLFELERSWASFDLHRSDEWVNLQIELFPEHLESGIFQIWDDDEDDDDPLVIPEVFRRRRS
jgi:hypothetical protein